MTRLAALIVTLLTLPFAAATAEERPERIVALSWGLAEALVVLDVPPVGVADLEGYTEWVRSPALPEGVADVGLRTEPSLERLAELAPDLILASDQQAAMEPALSRIAPVEVFEAFDADQDNAAKAREILVTLGERVGKADRAQEVLAQTEARMAEAGERVRAHFGGTVPPVLPIRLLTPTTVRVHGANSLAHAALMGMGLQHADPGAPTDWGFVQRNVDDLAAHEDAIVLNIGPFVGREKLYATQLWQFMPFVREDRYGEVAPVWTFGGAYSLGRLAHAFADALTTLPHGDAE